MHLTICLTAALVLARRDRAAFAVTPRPILYRDLAAFTPLKLAVDPKTSDGVQQIDRRQLAITLTNAAIAQACRSSPSRLETLKPAPRSTKNQRKGPEC